MIKKIFRSALMIAAAVLLSSLAIILGCLYDYFGTVQASQLKDELRLAAYAVEESGQTYLERLTARDCRYTWTPEYRLTWIGSDGSVLFDTDESAENISNHGDRMEVREAFAKGESSCVRYSDTWSETTLYYAKALNDGTVLRISTRQVTVPALLLTMLQPILLVGVLAVILSAVLAGRMAKRIVRPLNSLDLDHPLENDAYEELSPLLRRIQQQRRQINAQMQELRARTDEFEQITGSMKEGLVVLNQKGTILSINPAAQTLFHTDRSCVQKDFVTVDRGHELSQAILTALENGHSKVRIEQNGREIEFDISRIESDSAVIGTVLLAFDVTEQALAERSRREFTANVSHELKTPLQSIMGSAELLESGLVRQEDVPQFTGTIRKESARLVALVEDIIHLSQLDEGAVLEWELVDLLKTAKDAASVLYDKTREKGIRLSIAGESAQVNGVRGLLYEMIYNLCDNAIKYNVKDGSVEITVSKAGLGAVVTVRDTGIGIPPEYQSRVFERFFRVDKSRSKASGGTGLGLSIVKHIAQYHNAKITLQSELSVGTTVIVTFVADTI
ncbi:MAG: two-component sensor histidine kinase [Lachnospiraceae bacterium]|nr:two-component sensor histidine kinase [Lachnospiraceae bacterium]